MFDHSARHCLVLSQLYLGYGKFQVRSAMGSLGGGYRGSSRQVGNSFSVTHKLEDSKHPQPANQATQYVMWKIPPCKCGAQERLTKKGRPNLLQETRAPKLQYFQETCDSQHSKRYLHNTLFPGVEEERHQAPEDFIHYSSTIVVEPPHVGPLMEFAQKAQRRDYTQRQ
jgi:hypothetical protein